MATVVYYVIPVTQCVLCDSAHLFPNLSMELYFLMQLLITQASNDDLPTEPEELDCGKKYSLPPPHRHNTVFIVNMCLDSFILIGLQVT